MNKSLLFCFAILFFLFINIRSASASATCWNLHYGYFDVEDTCSNGVGDGECGADAYCNYWDALCGTWGGPCEPLDCSGCQIEKTTEVPYVDMVKHECVDQTWPPSTPNCCSRPCIEGGLAGSYSASLYDQTCYDLTNIDNDVNNCGFCGNECPNAQICSSGSCVCPIAGQVLIDGICTEPTCIPCSDGTFCDVPTCSNVNPGQRCIDDGSHIGQLVADVTCTPCTATLSFPSVGSDNPCSVVAKATDTSGGKCNGKAFSIKEAGTLKCEGTISGTSGTCFISPPQTGGVAHTYNLYVAGASKDTKSATCGDTPLCPHGDQFNCNADSNCKWCGSQSSCIYYSAYSNDLCTPNNCQGQTTKAACEAQLGDSFNFDCGWCPNSYNGGTSANGGTCMKAENLAANCENCFAQESYYVNTNYAECNGMCPSYSEGVFPVSGASIYGGWCDTAREYCSANGPRSCNCLGNLFNTAKSSDITVNCGECAINANNKDCGGTAVDGKISYNGQTYTGNEGMNVYSGVSAIPYDATLYRWCGTDECTTGGGYVVPCESTSNYGYVPVLYDHPNSDEILCGTGQISGTCMTGYGHDVAVNTCNKGDTCGASGNYYGGGKCCPAGYPYYNSADSLCYSEYKPPCADGIDNDKDCLIDCDDPDCAEYLTNSGCSGGKTCQSNSCTCPSDKLNLIIARGMYADNF